LGIAVHTLPSAANVIRGEVRVARQFDVDEAIAERGIHAEPVAKVNEVYVDRVVLVTGAGGSIGSELSRQISKLRIASLILLDNDESSIVEVQNELKDTTATARILPIVGDIRDERLVHHVFTQHSPDIVLHAAGYKHVPVLESNASEAVLNNVIGTRNLRDAALQVNSERFVMVSSDKAVRPSSVMGATKRLAEILIQRRGASAPRTRFACVRFGNVIGSRGSVVPIFLKQIAEGKAITVTDERMSRYFMTMKDAVQLVLQASSLALHGEIYILNMREPIKIIALARTLIEKSALRPDTDVPVRIIGSRPGEKLEEILWEDEAPIAATEFPGVYSLGPGEVPDDFEIQVSQLEQIALNRQHGEVLAMLRCMQIGYRESTEIRV